MTFDFENSSEQGELSGGFTDYIDVDKSGSISDEDIIFWYTSTDKKGDRTRKVIEDGTTMVL